MLYVYAENINQAKIPVTITYSTIPEGLENNCVAVDIDITQVPVPQEIVGKRGILYLNPTTKEFTYEYVTIDNSQSDLATIKTNLKAFVVNGKITTDDYKNITGITYVP